jgi:pimeloyl-ACP methyl ester carboxylesterase
MLQTVLTMRGWRRPMMTRDILAAVETPTHFVWGERDVFAPPSSGQDMVRRMHKASIHVLPNTGNLPHVDEPAMVAQAITRFYRTT